jgi:hypothetical protein
MSMKNKGECSTCQQNKLALETSKTLESVEMNNNPIKLLFNLGSTAVDVMTEYSRRGLLVADEKKVNMRMELCSGCKMFEKESTRCKLCGCFMNLKIRLVSSTCPVGKW